MQSKYLETFLAVARTLNFGQAARELNYSQSTVSEHVRLVEVELGVRLFERLGRKIFLTSSGERLVRLGSRLLQAEEEVRQAFCGKETLEGMIRLGASESLCAFWLPPLLKEYRALYPQVQLYLKVGHCSDFGQWLQQNLVDVAFGFQDESGQPQLRQETLFQGKTVLVAEPQHPLANLPVVETQQLAGQTFIFSEGHSGYPAEMKELLAQAKVPVTTFWEFESLEAIKQCVKNGLGLSLLPEIVVAEELKRGTLVRMPWDSSRISVVAQMVWHREKWLSPPLAALEKLVKGSLRSLT